MNKCQHLKKNAIISFVGGWVIKRAENVEIIQIHPYTAKLDVRHRNM